MKLYLIRHGRQCSKLCNVDVDLDEAGYRQAALAGERLSYARIDVLYSSNLLRAVETAQTANYYLHVNHYVRPDLREVSFGDLEGMSDAAISLNFADFKAEQDKMEFDLPYPGGESAGDVISRVLPVFREMAESGYQNIAVVTHGGVIRCMTAHYMGIDLARWRKLGNLENGSITVLEYDRKSKGFNLERFNDYAHLEPYPDLLRSSWADAEN